MMSYCQLFYITYVIVQCGFKHAHEYPDRETVRVYGILRQTSEAGNKDGELKSSLMQKVTIFLNKHDDV